MSKQLIFVSGAPFSGRTTWVNKNLLSNTTETVKCIDANEYPLLLNPNKKVSEDSIEASRLWCLEQVRMLMDNETPTQKIVLCLIACRADRWREFIQLAIEKEYEISFRFPSNKLLFYVSKHNTSMEQCKFLEQKALSRYPRDKKEFRKQNSKNPDEVVYKDTNESTLFRYVVTEFESGYSFYLQHKTKLGSDKEEWLKTINQFYKITIINEIKRAQKRAEREVLEAEKARNKAEKEAKRLAKIEAEAISLANQRDEDEEDDDNNQYMVDYTTM